MPHWVFPPLNPLNNHPPLSRNGRQRLPYSAYHLALRARYKNECSYICLRSKQGVCLERARWTSDKCSPHGSTNTSLDTIIYQVSICCNTQRMCANYSRYIRFLSTLLSRFHFCSPRGQFCSFRKDSLSARAV